MSEIINGFSENELARYRLLAEQTRPDIQEGAHKELQDHLQQSRNILSDRHWKSLLYGQAIGRVARYVSMGGIAFARYEHSTLGMVAGVAAFVGSHVLQDVSYNRVTRAPAARVSELQGIIENAGITFQPVQEQLAPEA